MKMAQIIGLEDMKFLYDEMCSILEDETLYDFNSMMVNGRVQFPVEGMQQLYETQQKALGIAKDMGKRYLEIVTEETDYSIKATNYLQYAEEVIVRGEPLNRDRYIILLNLTSSLAYNAQEMRMERLIDEGYWEVDEDTQDEPLETQQAF